MSTKVKSGLPSIAQVYRECLIKICSDEDVDPATVGNDEMFDAVQARYSSMGGNRKKVTKQTICQAKHSLGLSVDHPMSLKQVEEYDRQLRQARQSGTAFRFNGGSSFKALKQQVAANHKKTKPLDDDDDTDDSDYSSTPVVIAIETKEHLLDVRAFAIDCGGFAAAHQMLDFVEELVDYVPGYERP